MYLFFHVFFQASSSPPRMHKIERESPPIHHPPTLLHPALLAAAQHGGSPDYGHIRAPSGAMNMDNGDRNSDCNSGDISYDGMQPTISFLCKDYSKQLNKHHVCILSQVHREIKSRSCGFEKVTFKYSFRWPLAGQVWDKVSY